MKLMPSDFEPSLFNLLAIHALPFIFIFNFLEVLVIEDESSNIPPGAFPLIVIAAFLVAGKCLEEWLRKATEQRPLIGNLEIALVLLVLYLGLLVSMFSAI